MEKGKKKKCRAKASVAEKAVRMTHFPVTHLCGYQYIINEPYSVHINCAEHHATAGDGIDWFKVGGTQLQIVDFKMAVRCTLMPQLLDWFE